MALLRGVRYDSWHQEMNARKNSRKKFDLYLVFVWGSIYSPDSSMIAHLAAD